MDKVATVYYDGEVFRPEGLVDLPPNARYVITIEVAKPVEAGTLGDLLRELAGTIDGPPDWAAEHDHYIHGLPKREGGEP